MKICLIFKRFYSRKRFWQYFSFPGVERCKAGRHRVVIEEAHFDFRSPSKTKFRGEAELKTQIKVTRGRPRPYWSYYLLYEIVHNIELDMDWSKKRSAERYLKHDAPNLIHGQPGPKQGVFEMIFTKIGKSKLLRRHSLKMFPDLYIKVAAPAKKMILKFWRTNAFSSSVCLYKWC